ncbi:MAG: MotA/TolQ/ExbB proton channel family protein [Pseudomonadota bacterium]
MAMITVFAQSAAAEAAADVAAAQADAAETGSGTGTGAAAEGVVAGALDLVLQGGPMLWLIFLVSVLSIAVILFKFLSLLGMRAWERSAAEAAIEAWAAGDPMRAKAVLNGTKSVRCALVNAAVEAVRTYPHDEGRAREETERVAKGLLADAASGLRTLDVIATLAPLMGLLGTVLGMIAAFQALQASGASADPATLAGGIWEALLTTAAGMAVAIPASAALSYFDGVVDRMRLDFEDLGARVFNRPATLNVKAA